MMIEALSAYHFLRGMGGGQCLFVWKNQNIRPEPDFAGFRADVLLTGYIFLVELKDRSPIRRQRIREGVWLAVALALLGTGGEGVLAAFVESVFGIQDQGVGSGFRNAYPVIIAGNRSEVDDE